MFACVKYDNGDRELRKELMGSGSKASLVVWNHVCECREELVQYSKKESSTPRCVSDC